MARLKKKYNFDCKDLINIFGNRGLIKIDTNIIVDEDIEVDISITYLIDTISLFYIICDTEFRNVNFKVNINNIMKDNIDFYFINNNSKKFRFINCDVQINLQQSCGMRVIYNNGDDDTHMETRADYLIVDKCNIKVYCNPNDEYRDSIIYGIYNSLANSISITNTFIEVINKGICLNQKVVGIYTNGRFGRIIGNNIKANSSHPEGLLLEQAHSYGIINEGLYTIISNNNIIAEWAGVAVSVENKGDSALINGNKILATHTICGRGIRNTGEKVMITNNIIISTSKNARLIEHKASNSIISHNHLEVLIPPNECVSGVGIYADSKYIGCNTITENMICNIKDCGIFVNPNIGIVSNNQVVTNLDAIKITGSDNFRLSEVLNERNIKSIRSGIDEEA